MLKGCYRIREYCGGRYSRKSGIRRVAELTKLLRRAGVKKIRVYERTVESARELAPTPFWAVKADATTNYFEVTFESEY